MRIMSIHKSKGLEFPVVFLSGMGKSFNQMDSRAALVLHSRMGIGADAIGPEHRVRPGDTAAADHPAEHEAGKSGGGAAGALRCHDATEGEADYDGHGVEAGEPREAVRGACGRQEELLSYQTLSSASGYLDWILPAFSRNRCFDGLYEQFGLAGNADNPLYAEKIPVTILPCITGRTC